MDEAGRFQVMAHSSPDLALQTHRSFAGCRRDSPEESSTAELLLEAEGSCLKKEEEC